MTEIIINITFFKSLNQLNYKKLATGVLAISTSECITAELLFFFLLLQLSNGGFIMYCIVHTYS